MNRILLLVVLLVAGVAGCDSNAKYRDAQLKRGVKIADIKQQFGEPDSYDDWWDKFPYDSQISWGRKQSPEYPHHIEKLKYGAFGAHNQRTGHVTQYRLSMTFVNDELYTWEKSAPAADK
jgi:hypothetical protein